MNARYVLGVDPGFSGALSIIDPLMKRVVLVLDMPLRPVSCGKKAVDPAELVKSLEPYSKKIAFAVIEEVGPRPEEGVSSVFRFGYGAGTVLGVLVAMGLPVFFVKPEIWKSLLNLSRDKSRSLNLASQLFPEDAPYLWPLKKHHDRAEATLLANFGAERFERLWK